MIDQVIEQIQSQAGNVAPLGAKFKFVLDDNIIFIDGTGDSNVVSTDDQEADCTMTSTVEVLQQLKAGDLNPMMAVMSGKIKIKGDMGLAMKLQGLLG